MTDQNPFEELANVFLKAADDIEKLELKVNTPAWHFQQNMIQNAKQYRHTKLVDDAYQKGHDEGFKDAVYVFRGILENAEPNNTVGDIEEALNIELDELKRE